MKHKCFKCPKMAVWWYMPGRQNSDSDYYCDNCVSRGCSCNIIPDTEEEEIDDQGRFLPCCEYDHNENGYEEG